MVSPARHRLKELACRRNQAQTLANTSGFKRGSHQHLIAEAPEDGTPYSLSVRLGQVNGEPDSEFEEAVGTAS